MLSLTCFWTSWTFAWGKLYSFKGTLATLRNRKKPSSDGNKNKRLLPALPARAVRPTLWM